LGVKLVADTSYAIVDRDQYDVFPGTQHFHTLHFFTSFQVSVGSKSYSKKNDAGEAGKTMYVSL